VVLAENNLARHDHDVLTLDSYVLPGIGGGAKLDAALDRDGVFQRNHGVAPVRERVACVHPDSRPRAGPKASLTGDPAAAIATTVAAAGTLAGQTVAATIWAHHPDPDRRPFGGPVGVPGPQGVPVHGRGVVVGDRRPGPDHGRGHPAAGLGGRNLLGLQRTEVEEGEEPAPGLLEGRGLHVDLTCRGWPGEPS